MNSGSGQSYMDKLKAKNIPQAIIEEQNDQSIPTVQLSAEEWKRLTEAVQQMEKLSAELSTQKTVVAPTRTHGSSDALSITLMGARGVGNITGILADDYESEEEKRQREAQNVGSALGLVTGIVAGIVVGLVNGQASLSKDVNCDGDEDEDFDITM